MKYVSINTTSSKENFEIREDERVLADISFSKQTRFVRIVSDLGRRIFSFEMRGFLSPRKVIRNEYGFRLGKVEETNSGAGKGVIELEGKKYSYLFDQNNLSELTVYDETMKTNLLTCSFNALTLGINKTKSILDSRFASLLLVICWYSLQPHHHGAVAETI